MKFREKPMFYYYEVFHCLFATLPGKWCLVRKGENSNPNLYSRLRLTYDACFFKAHWPVHLGFRRREAVMVPYSRGMECEQFSSSTTTECTICGSVVCLHQWCTVLPISVEYCCVVVKYRWSTESFFLISEVLFFPYFHFILIIHLKLFNVA